MELEGLYRQEKLNSINTLTCTIEKVSDNCFSVLLFDEEMEVWIEKFTETIEKAKATADRLFNKIKSEY